jgi:uncharacterized membrane protein
MKFSNLGLRERLFYIGVIVFSLTLLIEQLFPINANVIAFFKGLGAGLEFLGAVFLIIKKTSHKS